MDWWVWAIGIVLVLAFIGYLMGPQRDKPITKRDHRILEQRRASLTPPRTDLVRGTCQFLQDGRVDTEIVVYQHSEHLITNSLGILCCVEVGLQSDPVPGQVTTQLQEVIAYIWRVGGDGGEDEELGSAVLVAGVEIPRLISEHVLSHSASP